MIYRKNWKFIDKKIIKDIKMLNIVIILILILMTLGCSKSVSISALNGNAKDLYLEADNLIKEENVPESIKILNMIEEIHPEDEDIKKLAESLDGQIMRLAGPDVPAVPFSPPFEDIFMVNKTKILDAVRNLSAY